MKHWLQTRTLREQLLVTVLIIAAVVVWLFAASDRVSARVTEWKTVRKQLVSQQLWLDDQARIEARTAESIKHLDPARTLDPTKLVAALTTLAQQAGLQPSIDAPQTQTSTQFNYHTVRVNFRKVSMGSLLTFYDELTKQVPYLNLEFINLQADKARTGQLDATLQIVAPQVAK
ncbi:GspMb/PilO family protein [Oleiharenicola lentus]|uniref:GspMb/PilO family protein n=1 Tax=Oleiharenicola lentus TaxID=2508720 RepID=UPI003F66E310